MRIPALISALVLLGSGKDPAPSRYPDRMIDSLMQRGIDLTLRQEYERARETFRGLEEAHPAHPAGPLMAASVLQTMAMDYEELADDGEFDSLLEVCKNRAEFMIEDRPESAWGYYFLGAALGNEALAEVRRGNWLGGAIKAMASASRFEEALERDSMLIDACAGLGTYYYWKTRRMEFLAWLPFVADRRTEGIELLERCAKEGLYNRYAAMSSLISIQLDRKDYQGARELAESALVHYPTNRLFLWGLATALEGMGLRKEAINAYERLLEAIRNDSRPNPYNELVCRMNLYRLRGETGNPAPSAELSEIRRLLQGNFPDHLSERVEEKRQRLALLERKLGKGSE